MINSQHMGGFKRDKTSVKTGELPEVWRSPPDVSLYFAAVTEMQWPSEGRLRMKQIQAALNTPCISRLLRGSSKTNIYSWCHYIRGLQATQEVTFGIGNLSAPPCRECAFSCWGKQWCFFPWALNMDRQGRTGAELLGSYFSCATWKSGLKQLLSVKLLLHFYRSQSVRSAILSKLWLGVMSCCLNPASEPYTSFTYRSCHLLRRRAGEADYT